MTSTAPPDAAAWRLRKIRLVSVLFAVTVAAGGVRGMQHPDSHQVVGIDVLWGIAIVVAAAIWCTWDGRERETGRRVAVGWIVLFALVAVPVHLFRTRGARGGSIASLLALLTYVGLALAYEGGSLLMATGRG